MAGKVYFDLREQLDQYSVGFPATKSGIEIKIHRRGYLFPLRIVKSIEESSMYMTKILLKKFAGLSHRYRILLLIGALGFIVCGAVLGNGREKQMPVESASPRLVRSFTVISAQGGVAEYTGVIHARTESDLGFRVSGKIIEKLVKAGDHVKRGQTLMRLDPTDLQLAVNAARANEEAARAQNNRAVSDERRQRALVTIEAVSVQQYDHAKSAADATTAQLNSAIAYSRQMENQVGYAVLRADADGVIMERPADVGQVVSAGNVVIRLAHDGAREAVVNLPEGNTKIAKTVAIARLYADSGQTFPAKLRELSAMADPLTRTYQARYSLGGGENAPLGATVTVHLYGDNGNGAAQPYEIPVGALYDDGTGTSVWVIDPDTLSLSRRFVQVAKLGSETALVSKGLKPGERILALGTHLVKEGERVNILPGPEKEHR
ncbi:RND family efflux transporter, MFP subunit [Desulfomonile tiedjei DSM 6799]|uniref:RND family efflux transporter, MFP subunit n=2 Tax=Desulfomonile tiedjei TaxID=2358 RepID=I4CEJ6_DESTA|nr:RND family efflux transporter, MFP subunit [Desulfomonile tiedjei DSM 6799]